MEYLILFFVIAIITIFFLIIIIFDKEKKYIQLKHTLNEIKEKYNILYDQNKTITYNDAIRYNDAMQFLTDLYNSQCKYWTDIVKLHKKTKITINQEMQINLLSYFCIDIHIENKCLHDGFTRHIINIQKENLQQKFKKYAVQILKNYKIALNRKDPSLAIAEAINQQLIKCNMKYDIYYTVYTNNNFFEIALIADAWLKNEKLCSNVVKEIIDHPIFMNEEESIKDKKNE